MTVPFYPGQTDYIQKLNDLVTATSVYYGALAADPSTRPDGTPRQVGDYYYNIGATQIRMWSGSAWSPPNLVASQLAAAGGGALVGNTPAGNLSATTVQAAINELDAEKTSLNLFINGGVTVDQRNNGSAVNIAAGASAYVLDRWIIANSTNQTVIVQQANATFDGSDVHKRIRIAFAVAPTSGTVSVIQRIGGAETLAGQTATASCFVGTAETALAASVYAAQVFGTGGSPTVALPSQFFTPNGSVLRYSGVFTLPSIVGKTIGSPSYLEVGFNLPIRSTNPLTFTDAQFERGAVATPFIPVPAGTTLALCQRYLPVVQISNALHAYLGQVYSATAAEVFIPFTVTPRVAPTGMAASGTIAFTQANGAITGTAVFLGATTSGATLGTSGASGLVAGNATSLIAVGGVQTIQFTGCEL